VLAAFAHDEKVDLALGTGDWTAMGTHPELAAAARRADALAAVPLGLVTVPGNHDVYLADAARDARFDRHFAAHLASDRPDLATDGRWPLVRLLGDDVATVCVNSARPNPEFWKSSGRIPDAQIDGLRRALADDAVRRRFVVVATHYAPRLWHGGPDRALHGLENADAFLDACASLTRGFVAHGHVHRRFAVRVPELRVPIFGAGSTTERGHEGLWLYDVTPTAARATPGTWDGTRYVLDPAAAVAL
jgi:hypothetical protein